MKCFIFNLPRLFTRCDGQYAARCTLNSCLVGVVIALPQKRSDESNGTLVDNTKGISCFGIRDYLDNYCPSLPCIKTSKFALTVFTLKLGFGRVKVIKTTTREMV